MESNSSLQVQPKRQVILIGNATNSLHFSQHQARARKISRWLAGALQVGWQHWAWLWIVLLGAQTAGIHLSWALGSFTSLPQDNTPCHPNKAALLRCLACPGGSCIEASAPILLMCIWGVLWYLLCARDGSSSSFPCLLHMQMHTLQAVQCISRVESIC